MFGLVGKDRIMITLNMDRNFNKQKTITYYGMSFSVPNHGFIALKQDTTFDENNHYIIEWFKYKPYWNDVEGWFDLQQAHKVIAEVSSDGILLTKEDLIESLMDVSSI